MGEIYRSLVADPSVGAIGAYDTSASSIFAKRRTALPDRHTTSCFTAGTIVRVREDIFVADPPLDANPTDQLRETIGTGNPAQRARAMGALARRAAREPALLDEVIALISDVKLRQLRCMGTVSIAHIGVACLAIAGSQDVRERLALVLREWPEPDRKDLLWFLKSQEIQLEAISV